MRERRRLRAGVEHLVDELGVGRWDANQQFGTGALGGAREVLERARVPGARAAVFEVEPDEVHAEVAAELDHGRAVRVVEDAERHTTRVETLAECLLGYDRHVGGQTVGRCPDSKGPSVTALRLTTFGLAPESS
jgi:hypothetical protein